MARSPVSARVRRLRARADQARSSHASVEIGFGVLESDSAIGGGLLAGALAYRLFVLLLPLVLLLVSGLGIYADAADQSPNKVAEEAGLHGLIATHVADTASSPSRWILFLVMIPAVLYALAKLYRAVAIVHALAWRGTGRGIGISVAGIVLLGVAILVDLGAVGIVDWIRRHSELGSVAALLVYFVLVGGTWLLASRRLPGGDAGWSALVPGALLIGVGLLLVNVFNVYVTTRLVENRANTYGALGIAAALLFSLVLVGRVVVIGAELNASIHRHRHAHG
ncbi:MAG TPA: YhjD/YihY/BrkB family envelope integrity protein [Gaiellaceae bacterium]